MNYDNNTTITQEMFVLLNLELMINDVLIFFFFYKFVTCELLFDKHHFCYDISTALLTDPV